MQVDAAVRADFDSRHRHKLLEEFLDRLDEEHGPVDEALVEKYVGLLTLLDQIATGLHDAPALADEAVSRAGIYADHP